jgi:hypothetical protein
MHLMLQALRITKNTSISSVPAASLHTAGDANYHGVCESGRVATKPGQSFTQSKIMSLYSNGSHKAVEPAQGQTEHMLDSNHPEPDQRGKNSLASKYFSGLYHTTQTENKEPISISSPEAEEKHNLYAYTRKRCRNPYGAKTWSKKARTSQTEEIGSDEDAAEAPPTSFVTASHKLAIDALKKTGRPSSLYQGSFTSSGPPQTGLVKTLGMSRRGVRGSFVPPVRGQMEVPVVVQLLLLTHKVALTMAMKSQHENALNCWQALMENSQIDYEIWNPDFWNM